MKVAPEILFAKIDADKDWFPGKADYSECGAPLTMTGQQRAAVARCAMTLKANDEEPTYAEVVANCPKAAFNPKTKKPFSKKTIYTILKEDCYDDDPCIPWKHMFRYSKADLT